MDYNEETKRYFLKVGQSDNSLYEPLRDFIYQHEDIGNDNAYTFTAYGLDILNEILDSDKSEDEILEQITEQADSYTPIYYHEIGEWLKDNVSLVDEIKAELGSETGDTYKDTQVAYCITLERVTNDLYELVKELKG
jgi:hypothetical protein